MVVQERSWPPASRPIIIGIAGGSGSGKTTIAHAILSGIVDQVAFIQHDSYYRDLTHLELEERRKVNYDHPDSLETELLVEHMEALKAGQTIEVPVYDFSVHNRTEETTTVEPCPVVVIEGILVLAEPALRAVLDLMVYVDTEPDLRFIRRLERDVNERERSVRSVIDQYHATVRPMHLQFVEPSKRHADIIIPEGYNEKAVATVRGLVESLLEE